MPEHIEFHVFRKNFDPGSIGANDILDICTTRSGNTYIATFGGGISKIEKTDAQGFPISFKTYSTTNGLPSDIILSLLEDLDGNLWIATEENLTKFTPKQETFENFSEIKRLMKKNSFSECSRFRINDGNMLFGFSHGIVVFDPQNININTFKPYLALTQLKVFNRQVPISEKGVLQKNINYVNHLTLKHNQNFSA